MTVKELKELLAPYPDDATVEVEVVMDGGDSIAYDATGVYHEDYDEDMQTVSIFYAPEHLREE